MKYHSPYACKGWSSGNAKNQAEALPTWPPEMVVHQFWRIHHFLRSSCIYFITWSVSFHVDLHFRTLPIVVRRDHHKPANPNGKTCLVIPSLNSLETIASYSLAVTYTPASGWISRCKRRIAQGRPRSRKVCSGSPTGSATARCCRNALRNPVSRQVTGTNQSTSIWSVREYSCGHTNVCNMIWVQAMFDFPKRRPERKL